MQQTAVKITGSFKPDGDDLLASYSCWERRLSRNEIVDTTRFDWCDESFEKIIRNALLLGTGLKEIGKTAEDTAVHIAVTAEESNLQRAAKRLGVTDRALQQRRASRQTH